MIHIIKSFIEKVQKKFYRHDYTIMSIIAFADGLISLIPFEFLFSLYSVAYKKSQMFKMICLTSLCGMCSSIIIYFLGYFSFDYINMYLNYFDINFDLVKLDEIKDSYFFYLICFLVIALPFTPSVLGVFVCGLLKANIFIIALLLFLGRFLKYSFFTFSICILSDFFLKKIKNIYLKIICVVFALALILFLIWQSHLIEYLQNLFYV